MEKAVSKFKKFNFIFTSSNSDEGGNIINSQNTNVLDVLWGNTSGTYTLYVIETDINGCIGDAVSFSVNVVSSTNIEEYNLPLHLSDQIYNHK